MSSHDVSADLAIAKMFSVRTADLVLAWRVLWSREVLWPHAVACNRKADLWTQNISCDLNPSLGIVRHVLWSQDKSSDRKTSPVIVLHVLWWRNCISGQRSKYTSCDRKTCTLIAKHVQWSKYHVLRSQNTSCDRNASSDWTACQLIGIRVLRF